MVDESAVYRDLMRFKPEELSPNAWAVRAGVSRTVWADMRRHGNPSRKTLEKLLAVAGSSLAEFEALRIGEEARPSGAAGGRLADFARRGWSPAQLPPLPIVATSLAGEWGEQGSGIELTGVWPQQIVDYLPRPAGLSGDGSAYALTIVGDSMWPRFRPGRRVAVSPRSPVAIGDDVIVRLGLDPDEKGGSRALIKELVRRTAATVELRQFSPDLTFSVRAAEIEAIHRIAGELI